MDRAWSRFVMSLLLMLCAGVAQANFEVLINPNPVSVEAGSRANFTLITQNQGLPPEAFSIEYSILGIRSAEGQTIDLIMAKVVTKAPMFGPLTFSLPIPAQTPSGEYSLSLRGEVMKNEGGAYGSKDFPDVLKIVVQGKAPAASGPVAPCAALLEPQEITLTNDRTPVEVKVRTSPDCAAPSIRYLFGMLPGSGFTADLCTVPVQKLPDGSYPEVVFTVRAAPNAPLRDWDEPIRGVSGTSTAEVVQPALMLKVHVVGAAAPTPPPAQPLPLNFPPGQRILKNRESGNCLTAENAARAAGTRLIMAPCGSQSELQTFSFGPHGEIHSANLCVVLSGNSTDDNTPIVLWNCNNGGQNNEMWTLDSSSRLIGRQFQKCLEPNGNDEPGHAAILRPCWEGANQKWSLDAPPPPPPAAPQKLAVNFPAQKGMLKNRESGKCLRPENISQGSRLVLEDCKSVSYQTFTFGPNGEIEVGGFCAVLQSNGTDDNTPIVLWQCSRQGQSNEIWTMDSSSRIVGRQTQKCFEPNGADPSHALIFRPCWEGDNQRWSIEQPAAGGEFSVTARESALNLLPGTAFTELHWVVTPANPIDMPNERLNFTFTFDKQLLAQPYADEFHGSVLPTNDISSSFRGLKTGQGTIHLTVTGPSTNISHSIDVPVTVGDVVVRGHWIEPQIPQGVAGDEEGPQARHGQSADVPSLPGTFSGVETFSDVLAKVEAEAVAFDGLGAAAAAAGEDVLEPEQIELLEGFSNLQSALLAQLHNGTPLSLDEASLHGRRPVAMQTADTGFDEDVVKLFIRGALRRDPADAPPPFQVASMGAIPFLFAMDFGEMAENRELLNDIKQGRVDWRELARRREPVEILVDMMRAANQNATTATYTSIVNDVLKETNDRLESLYLDKIPLKQWQAAVKTLSTTATAITVINILSQAQLKIMPARIAELYSNVGDYSRQPDAPNPKVMQGAKASLKVYMTAKSLGGEILRPSQIAELITKPLWEKFKDRLKKVGSKKKIGKPGDQGDEGGGEDAPGLASQNALKDLILDDLAKRFTAIPALRAWAQKLDAPLTVRSYKRGPFLINSERVLTLKYDNQHNNRSDKLIKLGETSMGHYFIQGVEPTRDGKTAGYSYGLQGSLITSLGQATEGLPCVKPSDPTVPPQCGLFRKGVVEVTAAPARECDLGHVGEPCSLNLDEAKAIAFGYAGGGVVNGQCECVPKK